MLTIAQKKEAVAELKDKFARAQSIFVADYSGLDVEAMNQLRRNLRAEGAFLRGGCHVTLSRNASLGW